MLRTATLLFTARWLTSLGSCGAFTAPGLHRPLALGTASSTTSSTTQLNLFGLRKKAGLSTLSKDEVRNLFYLWNDALATLDAQAVTDRFSKNAVLLPTVSDIPRTTPATIKEYFAMFLQLKPQGTILESNVMSGTNWCSDVGIYEFVMGATGAKVKARYSFVYVLEDGIWKIAHQHSSQMPEEMAAKINSAVAARTLSKPDVRKLFNLWNSALATGNPKTVAARYSKDAIFLPTVSDTPRKTKAAIEDYFVDFLKMKPQGVITDGVITTGENWANDSGVYEYTMGATGDKVRARYSITYTYEDGEWKILHHHSSAMPEDLLAADARVKAMMRPPVSRV